MTNMMNRANIAELGGGLAILASTQPLGGGSSIPGDSEMSDMIIAQNVANQGGGVYVDRLLDDGPVMGPGITIRSNTATEMGGGIAFDNYNVGVSLFHASELRKRRLMKGAVCVNQGWHVH